MTVESDTIAALASAPGRGAVALLRVSGPRACDLLRSVAPGWKGEKSPRRTTLTRIVDPSDGRLLDRALVTFFEAPRTFTGEDVVEITTHGGGLVPALVLAALERVGARPAEAGEFTKRAYLNGRLDLVQAEAVRDLVDARSVAFQQAAVHQMEGGLSRRLSALREQIVALEALLVHHIDFPDEDDPPTPLSRVREAGEEVAGSLRELLATAPQGELLREGALVVLAGRPNAGKSSLFNALLGVDRAIVTAEPGTTRDALEATVSLGGYPFRLVDTAGIREAEAEVERLGVEVARRYLNAAQIVLLCVSSEWDWGREEEKFLSELPLSAQVLVLGTKADRTSGEKELGSGEPEAPADARCVPEMMSVSVVDGRGLSELGERLPQLVFARVERAQAAGHPLLTHRRQMEGVRLASTELEAFVGAIDARVPAEIAATHLKPAKTGLEELLGIISPDEALDRLFADFCIGK